ncbi:hypothetical protein SP39_19 [Salmonella phage 39]|nr:hypothetical protein SP39_19 [Salmonella phage 39]
MVPTHGGSQVAAFCHGQAVKGVIPDVASLSSVRANYLVKLWFALMAHLVLDIL